MFALLVPTISVPPAVYMLLVIVDDAAGDIAECTKQRHETGQSSTRIASRQRTRGQNLAENLMRAIGIGGFSPRPEVAAGAKIVAQFVDPDAPPVGYITQCSVAVTY
ncbi:hypothetical protein [Mycobacterium sp.]|uniref:hypothetical protein n=1 Tax=Mycobacterium sp. TaxID=1785 RepID=UPI003F9CCFEC